MPASVRLVCHGDGNGLFGGRAALTLRIDLPDTTLAEEVVAEIQRRLRSSHPLVTVTADERDREDGLTVWHVHRDGHASLARPLS